VIGASTGGPRAIEEVLVGMGSVLQKIPVLVVQHMPPMFTGVFADHLRVQLGVRACEPDHGEPLVPGTVYIAPGGRHMGLSVGLGDPVVRLDDSPPVNFCRPAVDVLFRDAAAIFKNSALAVVLTGMGSDGTQGARLLSAAGATVIAQDEASSTVWGMPGSIVKAGLAQDVLPLESIGPAIKAHIVGSTP
jgi:two-component system chemotaxis response regulator CheB